MQLDQRLRKALSEGSWASFMTETLSFVRHCPAVEDGGGVCRQEDAGWLIKKNRTIAVVPWLVATWNAMLALNSNGHAVVQLMMLSAVVEASRIAKGGGRERTYIESLSCSS